MGLHRNIPIRLEPRHAKVNGSVGPAEFVLPAFTSCTLQKVTSRRLQHFTRIVQ